MIATLFIAIAVEFLGRDKSMWQDAFDYWLVLGLVGMSWCGLFACVRAMLDAPHAWMSGVAAAGLMAAAVFVSLALFARLGKATSGLTTFIMLVFLVPPMVLLVLV